MTTLLSTTHKKPSIGFLLSLAAIGAGAYWWFLAGGTWWWFFNITHSPPLHDGIRRPTASVLWVGTPMPETPEYANTRFGFVIRYPSPWRVSGEFTRQLASAGQAASFFNDDGEAALKCSTDKYCRRHLESRLKWYFRHLALEKSDMIVLVDLSEQEEQQFLQDVRAGSRTLQDFPRGHWIQIFPTYIDARFDKETPPQTTSRTRVKFLDLQDGTRATQVDSRAMGTGSLFVLLPHEFTRTLSSGKMPRSLELLTSADPDSEPEKQFYGILNSLRFK